MFASHWSKWARRPWIPRDLPASRIWLDGDIGLTLGTWADPVTGNSVTQAAGTQQGSIKTNAINGHTALTLDGVNDRYQGAFTLSQPYTIFLLYKSVTLGTFASHDILLDGNAVGTIAIVSRTDGPLYSVGNLGALSAVATVANGTYAYVSIQYNGASSFIRVNGTQIATGNCGASNPGGLTLGYVTDGRTANVEFQTIGAVASALSLADIARTELYLKMKGGL